MQGAAGKARGSEVVSRPALHALVTAGIDNAHRPSIWPQVDHLDTLLAVCLLLIPRRRQNTRPIPPHLLASPDVDRACAEPDEHEHQKRSEQPEASVAPCALSLVGLLKSFAQGQNHLRVQLARFGLKVWQPLVRMLQVAKFGPGAGPERVLA